MLRKSLLPVLLLPLVTLAAPAARAADMPASPSELSSAGRQEIEKFRAERLEGLKDPNGWLTLVGLFWLDEGDNPFGSDPKGKIVFPAGKAPARAGTLVRHGDQVTLQAAVGAGITVAGKPVTEVALQADVTGKATVMELGPLSFFLIRRGDRLGLRVKDRESPALQAFAGVEDFPLRGDWRIEARFEANVPAKKIPIANVLGMVEDQPSPGAVIFTHGGQTYRLDALANSDGTLSLVFGDETNGHETYGAGRFLDVDAPKDGKVMVDFNQAYNPPCAFTRFATCPLPPAQNKLKVRVEAGEKKYGRGEH